MDAVRKKRSQDGAGPSRRQELEETLAALRDQEAVVKRTIELLQAGAVGTKPQAGDSTAAAAVGGQPRPTAEPRDYEQRLRQVTEEQKRRAKAFWGDVRKLLTNLRANKQVLAVFGLPVRSTPWGGVPANWDLYCQSVSEPMDLGTVRAMLGEDESKRQYQSPEEVKNHIQLIVANARAFNKNPSDPVLPVAGSLEQMFAKKWQDGQFETRWRLETARRQVENEVRSTSAIVCVERSAVVLGTPPSAPLACDCAVSRTSTTRLPDARSSKASDSCTQTPGTQQRLPRTASMDSQPPSSSPWSASAIPDSDCTS